MKRKLFSLLLALALCAGLSVPACAQSAAEPEITWLSIDGEPSGYIPELDWLEVNTPDGSMVINLSTGEQIPEFDSVNGFSEGLARVRKGWEDGYGYIDQTGQVVISLQYDLVMDFSEGLAQVGRLYTESYEDGTGVIGFKWGYIDQTGKIVVPLEYDSAEDFSEGLALVAKKDAQGNRKWGYVDQSGRVVTPLEYDGAGSFHEGLALVVKYDAERNGKWGFIDRAGRAVIPLEYDTANDGGFSEGLAAVARDGGQGNRKWGFIDRTGQMVIPLEYDDARVFSEGLAAVAKDDGQGNRKWGFIDRTGRVVIPLEYDNVSIFCDGMAGVLRYDGQGSGKIGFIDRTGKLTVPLEYDAASFFSEGLAMVALSTGKETWQCGFVSRDGEMVLPLEYDEAGILPGGQLCWVKKGLSYGVFRNPYCAAPTAYASTQTVLVDGMPVTFECYALRDENGNDTNYVKLRDVAYVLSGTAAQFGVGWDQAAGAISVTAGQPYQTVGGEMSTPYSGDRSYTVSDSPLYVNGRLTSLEAIRLTDDGGNGYTYFKLRDLGEALGFTVGWSAQTGIFIETD